MVWLDLLFSDISDISLRLEPILCSSEAFLLCCQNYIEEDGFTASDAFCAADKQKNSELKVDMLAFCGTTNVQEETRSKGLI